MSFCTNCGSENFNDARYCQECGSPINQVETGIADEELVKERAKSDSKNHDDSDKKFNTTMRNSGILTLGLGIFLSLFSLYSGLITIFFWSIIIID